MIKRSVLAASVALVSLGVNAQSGAELEVGPFKVIPSLTLDAYYDDNIASTNTNKESSMVYTVAPSVQATADNGSSSVYLTYNPKIGRYTSTSNDNYTDHSFGAGAAFEIDRRNRVSVDASYAMLHEERGQGFSQGLGVATIVPDEYTQSDVKFTYGFGAANALGGLEFRLGAEKKDYDSRLVDNGNGIFTDTTATRDRKGTSYGATFGWDIGGRTAAFVAADAKSISYDVDLANSLDSDEYNIGLGVRWEATGRTTGSASFGTRKKDFDDPARQDTSGASWDIGVDYALTSYSNLNLATSRNFSEANGAGNSIDLSSYSASWTHSWNSRVSSTVNYSLTVSDYNGIDRKDETTNAGVALDYAFDRWLSMGVAYRYDERDSDLATSNYDGNVYLINVKASL